MVIKGATPLTLYVHVFNPMSKRILVLPLHYIKLLNKYILQAEFARLFIVTGVAITGRYGWAQYVRSFRVLYSRDCSAWQYVNTTSEPWTVRRMRHSKLVMIQQAYHSISTRI